MERRKFIKTCCYTAIGIPFGASMLQSCGAIYYASLSKEPGKLVVAKSEFINEKNNKKTTRDFVLLNMNELGFPICLYKVKNEYIASLLKCTHRGCELNVGGGIYSCPCHGSEFSTTGQDLEGPADQNLKVYKTETDEKNIYIYLS